ncbi:MAG: ABC transporter permease [Alteraurantiacibacter sp.]
MSEQDAPVANGRLPLWRAAWVVARRDFVAILFSRAFIFFLLGPLFPVVVWGLTAGVSGQGQNQVLAADVGLAMTGEDVTAMLAAREELAARLGPVVPPFAVLKRLEPGEVFDARPLLERREGQLAAVVTGTLEHPVLTAPVNNLARWSGTISLIAASAARAEPIVYPAVGTVPVATSGASENRGRYETARSSQVVLFMLIMLLAGMVLSNLVEEKGNKIIEILAAAIPMDAVFMGKLFAMLAVSVVGITVWGTTGATLLALGGRSLSEFANPGVGWPLFFVLGAAYFGMGYLLLGSIFLAVGSMAATVREVQTLSMPVTMSQILVFLFATMALNHPGEGIDYAAMIFPLSSPFAMLGRAAMDEALWPHAAALAWQALCVALFIKVGAGLFRRRVLKSGPQGSTRSRSLLTLLGTLFSMGSARKG